MTALLILGGWIAGLHCEPLEAMKITLPYACLHPGSRAMLVSAEREGHT
jgi:hypothetical protein